MAVLTRVWNWVGSCLNACWHPRRPLTGARFFDLFVFYDTALYCRSPDLPSAPYLYLNGEYSTVSIHFGANETGVLS